MLIIPYFYKENKKIIGIKIQVILLIILSISNSCITFNINTYCQYHSVCSLYIVS